MNSNQTIKLCVVGDPCANKTEFLLSYQNRKFSDQNQILFQEGLNIEVQVDSQNINLTLWDNAGAAKYNRVRTLGYHKMDGFLILFSVLDKESFQNVFDKWYPELSQDGFEKVPKLIVGTQIHQRDQNNEAHIKEDEARKIIEQYCTYFEYCLLRPGELEDIFQEAIRQALKVKEKYTTGIYLKTKLNQVEPNS